MSKSRVKHSQGKHSLQSKRANTRFNQSRNNAARLFEQSARRNNVAPASFNENVASSHSGFNGNRSTYMLFIFLLLTGSLIQQAQAASSTTLRKQAYKGIAATAAGELNQLYTNTAPCDSNEPAYHCSGIVIHGQLTPDTDNPLPSWRLPPHRNAGSFSYLRSDITPHVGEAVWINTGYILTPLDRVKERNQYPYKVYCEFPGDGATVGDVEVSCHLKSANEYRYVCTGDYPSIDAFLTKYPPTQNGKYWSPDSNGCAFLADKNSFDFAMQLHKYFYRDHADKTRCHETSFCRTHNELVVGVWDEKQVPDVQVPIHSFFAIVNDTHNPMFKESGRTSTSKEELEQLFKDADAYNQATKGKRQIPVVTLNMGKLRSGEQDVFTPAVRPGAK